jgi:sulfur-carrier protein adenylyltransferase/sulfurtransferase
VTQFRPFPPPVPEISPLELKERIDQGRPPVLLDVREPFEPAIADLPEMGQKRIPMGEVPARMGELDPDEPLVVYCRTGGRSARVAQYLLASGFTRVENLGGGVMGWRNEVDPSLQEY